MVQETATVNAKLSLYEQYKKKQEQQSEVYNQEQLQNPKAKRKVNDWFKFPWKAKSTMNKSLKLDEQVLVFYLTQKYQVKLKLVPIVSGNLIVVNNKVHKLNPRMIWKYDKYNAYIIREIDRLPVSNEDYDEIRDTSRDTDNDVPLIKAVLGAIQKKQSGLEGNAKAIIIAVVVIAVIGFGAYMLFGA